MSRASILRLRDGADILRAHASAQVEHAKKEAFGGRRDDRSREPGVYGPPSRGAAARRRRSLIAAPRPLSGIGATAMAGAPVASSARK